MEAIRAEVQKLVKAYIQLHPNGVNDLASELLVATSTIWRWSRGVNLPVTMNAEKVVKVLRRKMRTAVKKARGGKRG